MKYYGKIGSFRRMKIEVYRGEKLLYAGEVEDAPDEIKELVSFRLFYYI